MGTESGTETGDWGLGKMGLKTRPGEGSGA